MNKFRFHTGSIKSWNNPTRCGSEPRFDSILVRLKGTTRTTTLTPRPEFRFHTGSIKSNATQQAKFLAIEFRFHTGSIKREALRAARTLTFSSFDSILVRLKVRNRALFMIGVSTFRFHTGSIKSKQIQDAPKVLHY